MTRKKCKIKRKDLGILRVKAIRMRKGGAEVNAIAKAFGLHPASVSRWLTKYRRGGASVLKPRKSTGRPPKINCEEFVPRLKRLIKFPATHFGYESPLWNSRRLREVIAKELKIKISQPSMWRALRSIGLSYQKPERRAFEQDPIARKEWLDKEWPQLRKTAKRERAVILFADEASVSMNPTIGKTWAKIAQTPIVFTTGNRGSISVISAISPRGALYFKIPKGTVDSDEFIRFLKQILREIPRKKLYMVVDKGRSHTSKKTACFVAKNLRLKLVFLPSYSPDFNPDEFTWERLKQVEMKTHVERTKSGLKRKTLGAMRSIQKKSGLVKSFVKRTYAT